jgi:hypothetical protein
MCVCVCVREREMKTHYPPQYTYALAQHSTTLHAYLDGSCLHRRECDTVVAP